MPPPSFALLRRDSLAVNVDGILAPAERWAGVPMVEGQLRVREREREKEERGRRSREERERKKERERRTQRCRRQLLAS